jgi:thioredoxin-like negative regulator of GroEL
MVTFYDPSCKNSQTYLKEWEASIAQGKCMSPDQYAFVDCKVDKALCAKYGVQGYPTVVPFINGKMDKLKEYGGQGVCTTVKGALFPEQVAS